MKIIVTAAVAAGVTVGFVAGSALLAILRADSEALASGVDQPILAPLAGRGRLGSYPSIGHSTVRPYQGPDGVRGPDGATYPESYLRGCR